MVLGQRFAKQGGKKHSRDGHADIYADGIALEQIWKAKLQSREMGLNRN